MIISVRYQLASTIHRLTHCLVVLMLLIAVAGQIPALAQEMNAIPGGPNTRFGKPTLSILKPVHGETFGKESIVVDIAVENFELVQPEPRFGGPTNKPVGHLHIYLDSNPLIATTSRRIMIGTNANGDLMPTGWHTLTVELVDEDHNVLAPRQYQQVQFYTASGGSQHRDENIDGAGVSGFVK